MPKQRMRLPVIAFLELQIYEPFNHLSIMSGDFANKVSEILRKLREFPAILPEIVKGEGLQFISDNFKKGGFEASPGQLQKWPARKPIKGKKGKQSNSRALLVKSGQLRRSWDQETHNQTTQTIFQSSRPYAETHNEGGNAGRGSGFSMPQRQMIGPSKELDARIEAKIDREVDKLFN